MSRLLILASAAIALAVVVCPSLSEAADSPSARWEPHIKRFEERDKKSPPPQNAIVFIGSSSIRGWDDKKWFPDLKTINRGFGGSETADSVYYADRVLLPYKPRVVVLYAGDNDIAKGKSAERAFKDWQAFVAKVHGELPETKIVYIAIKPSISRWKLFDKMQQANKMIEAACEKNEKLVFLDIAKPMIGDDGKPRPELFKSDGLHMNEAGYEIWSEMLRPHLEAAQ